MSWQSTFLSVSCYPPKWCALHRCFISCAVPLFLGLFCLIWLSSIHVVIFLHPSFKCLLLQEAFPASLRNVHLTLFVFHDSPAPQHHQTSPLLWVFLNFYWRIVALQCCVSVYSTAKWTSHMYTNIPSVLDFPSIGHHRALSSIHWAIQ